MNKGAQGDVLAAAFVAGVPTTIGNGYLWEDSSTSDIAVTRHFGLTESVEYRFGSTILVQGGGVTRSRLACQTMVQIIR